MRRSSRSGRRAGTGAAEQRRGAGGETLLRAAASSLFLSGARHRRGGRRPRASAGARSSGSSSTRHQVDTIVEGGRCDFFSPYEFFFLVRYDTIMEGVGCDRLTANFAAARIDAAFRVSDEAARDGAAPLPCSCERRPFTTRAVCA